MEPLYRSIIERAKTHITYYDFLREHFTRHYLDARREMFGEDEHYKSIMRSKNGIFDKNPSLFLKLHEDVGQRFGISQESFRRDPRLTELYVLRINPKYAEELADKMARAAVAAEKAYGAPIWDIPPSDAVSILKGAMLEVHNRYKNREPVLVGPANII